MPKEFGNEPNHFRTFSGLSTISAWSSPESFVRHLESVNPKDTWYPAFWKDKDPSFYGVAGMEEAFDKARNGWKEGVELMEKMRLRILAANPFKPKPAKYDVVGSIPSIPRAVAGNPLNMKKITLKKGKKTITLISDMSIHCMIGKEAVCNRAALVACLIDMIENKGFACEVISVGVASEGRGTRDYSFGAVITVKESNQPVDLTRLSFALGHPGFIRKLVFAEKTVHIENKDTLCQHLGYSRDIDSGALNERNMYLIPSVRHNESLFKDEKLTVEKGLPWIVEELTKQGCPAFKN